MKFYVNRKPRQHAVKPARRRRRRQQQQQQQLLMRNLAGEGEVVGKLAKRRTRNTTVKVSLKAQQSPFLWL